MPCHFSPSSFSVLLLVANKFIYQIWLLLNASKAWNKFVPTIKMPCHFSPSSFSILLLVAYKLQLLVVVTVGKTSDVLLRDTQYKIKKVTRQPVTALGRWGYSTRRSAVVFVGKPVVQLNTRFKALFATCSLTVWHLVTILLFQKLYSALVEPRLFHERTFLCVRNP